MSGEDYKFQMSIKFGPGGVGMLNIRAASADEFVANVTEAMASVGVGAVLLDAFNTEFQGVSAPALTQQAAPAHNTNTHTSTSSGELCQHGSMVWRTGSGANGPWSGWFCPADKNDPGKCKPKFTPKSR